MDILNINNLEDGFDVILLTITFVHINYSINYLIQATMLKKNKFKRRPTEPNILPANGEGGKSTDD